MRWLPTKLGSLLTLEYGRALPRAARIDSGHVPVAGSNGVDGYHDNALVHGPGIVVGRKGSAGKVTWFDDDFWPIDTTYYVRHDPRVTNIRWLFYLLQSKKLERLNKTTGVPGLNRNDVYAESSLLPPLKEQSRIVELLDEADRLRRLARSADAKAARILPALFLKMFGDPATNPMGWPIEPLTKICNPKQWPTISAKELTESGFPVYGANGKIGFYSAYNHEHPTILITCRGATCGTINVCEPKSYVTGNAMALDDPDLKKTSLEFLECYLIVRGLNDTITGAAQPQITRQNLQPVTVFIPPTELVESFSRRARAIKETLANAQLGSEHLEGLFGLLLQRAFSGQLTAKWREAHMKELLAEMEEQARLLNLPMPIEREALA